MSKEEENYSVLSRRIAEREHYIEELEYSIENYKRQNEQYEKCCER